MRLSIRLPVAHGVVSLWMAAPGHRLNRQRTCGRTERMGGNLADTMPAAAESTDEGTLVNLVFAEQCPMPIPDKASAEAYLPYTKARCLRPSRGKAWRDLKAWITEPLRETEALEMPGVSEAYLAWTFSGEAEFQEREGNGPWITHRIKKGSFFLTTGGGPYECRWKALTPEPFLSMMTFVELPLLKRAMEEVFGAKVSQVRLRDLSAFTDDTPRAPLRGDSGKVRRRKHGAARLQTQAGDRGLQRQCDPRTTHRNT